MNHHIHRQRNTLATCIVAVLAWTIPAGAETWTDITGKFQVDAEYQGVVGTDVVLRKSDGSTINVPISRLSPASRAQAKAFYDQEQSSSGGPPREPQGSVVPQPAEAPNELKLSVPPPQPVAVQPLPPFPENASLQETIEFVFTQFTAGHPEVFWQALPDEMRQSIDHDRTRALAGELLKKQSLVSEQSDQLIRKALEVLISKREFVLNSQMMSQVPPPLVETIKQAYDPAMGLVYEVIRFSDALKNLEQRTIHDLLTLHGPLIGGHLNQLLKLAPEDQVTEFRQSLVIQETDQDQGMVTSTSPSGEQSETLFVRYQGRWIPQDFADAWLSSKDDLEGKLRAGMAEVSEASAQTEMMMAMFVGLAGSMLQPLANASTQQEFDQAIGQVMQMAGGLTPGGPGGGMPGLGGPGIGGPGLEDPGFDTDAFGDF